MSRTAVPGGMFSALLAGKGVLLFGIRRETVLDWAFFVLEGLLG
jgi:hypothetical protein